MKQTVIINVAGIGDEFLKETFTFLVSTGWNIEMDREKIKAERKEQAGD